jgi:hypothetical protein
LVYSFLYLALSSLVWRQRLSLPWYVNRRQPEVHDRMLGGPEQRGINQNQSWDRRDRGKQEADAFSHLFSLTWDIELLWAMIGEFNPYL